MGRLASRVIGFGCETREISIEWAAGLSNYTTWVPPSSDSILSKQRQSQSCDDFQLQLNWSLSTGSLHLSTRLFNLPSSRTGWRCLGACPICLSHVARAPPTADCVSCCCDSSFHIFCNFGLQTTTSRWKTFPAPLLACGWIGLTVGRGLADWSLSMQNANW